MDSIGENFIEAMKTSQTKLEFSKQFENIVKGVEVIFLGKLYEFINIFCRSLSEDKNRILLRSIKWWKS